MTWVARKTGSLYDSNEPKIRETPNNYTEVKYVFINEQAKSVYCRVYASFMWLYRFLCSKFLRPVLLSLSHVGDDWTSLSFSRYALVAAGELDKTYLFPAEGYMHKESVHFRSAAFSSVKEQLSSSSHCQAYRYYSYIQRAFGSSEFVMATPLNSRLRAHHMCHNWWGIYSAETQIMRDTNRIRYHASSTAHAAVTVP